MKEELDSLYQDVMESFKEYVVVGTAESILHWDMETKMPPRGIKLRSQQMGVLAQVSHRMITHPRVGDLLDRIEKHSDFEELPGVKRRNVELARKEYDENVKLPEELVAETEKQRAITIDIWKKAKAKQDFGKLQPELEKLVDLRREAADILMDVKGTATPYDALIDYFEPGMTSETIGKLFRRLREGLISTMESCRDAGKDIDGSVTKRKVAADAQRRFARELLDFLGYDIESEHSAGRLDETEHPFTTGYYDDVRITTHYYENKPMSSIFSVLHEAGHALYEQNLRSDWMFQPIGQAASYGVHESQSRFVENMLGRSPEFWSFFFPRLRELTGDTFSDIDMEKFLFAVNQVEPSKIRIEADEVTYGLHIIVRFEIENKLFADSLGVGELPELWNQKYDEYLGVEIENDSEGVMQDTHWASGYYGYFPTYALGNIYSGQILSSMEGDLPDWKSQVAAGDFGRVRNWMTEHVHKQGLLYEPLDLIKKISGRDLAVSHYLNYLDRKFSGLYGF